MNAAGRIFKSTHYSSIAVRKAAAVLSVLVIFAATGLMVPLSPEAKAGGGGAGDYVWIQQGPTPQGHTINSTCLLPGAGVVSAGGGGSAFYWNGTTLAEMPTGTSNDLYGVTAVAGPARAWAVGEGAVIRYYDGSGWVGQASPDPGYSYDLYGVTAVRLGPADTDCRAWAVGTTDGFHNAIILYYNGSTWSLDENYPTGQFCDIQSVLDGSDIYLWAVGTDTVNHGRVMFSTGDGTWTARNTDYALMSLSAADTTNLYGVEWDGTVLSSADGGTNWNSMFNDWWPAGISASAADNVWVVGWEGQARSWNGATWTDRSVGGADLYDAAATNLTSVAAGGEGRFLTFNGTGWDSNINGSTLPQYAVDGFRPGVDIAVVTAGQYDPAYDSIQLSTDAGITWSSMSSGVTSPMYGIYIVDANNAWVCGDRYVLRWNGSTWSTQYHPNAPVYCISMGSANRGWVGTDTAINYYNGSNWNSRYRTWTSVYGISAADTNNVYAVGAGGGIWRTSTGGTNFSAQTSGTTQNLRAVTAVNSTTAWAVGDNGTILHTTNSGGTWTAQTSGVSVVLRGVSAIDTNTAWAVGDGGTILYTDNAGATWTAQDSPTAENLNAVWAYDANNIWAVGDAGIILYADPPFVKAVCPRYAPPGTTVDEAVVLGGYTSFDWHTSTIDMGEGVTAVPVSNLNNSNTWMATRITVDPTAALGPRTVTVTTGDEVAVPLEGGFVIGDQPTITSVSPESVARGATLDVRVTGSATGFDNTSAAQFGAGVNVNSVKFEGPDTVLANITVSDDAAPGTRDVNVTTGAETPMPLSDGISVLPQPRVTGVSPDVGNAGDMVTINGNGFGPDRSYAGGRAVSIVEFDGKPADDYPLWTDNRIICKVPGNVESGPVTVETPGGTSNSDKVFDLISANSTWYLAEGTTAWGFNTYLTFENPNNVDVTAEITYMTPEGQIRRDPLNLAAMSQTTISPSNDLPFKTDFSTRVVCPEGRGIAVDRTMWWEGEGAPSPDGHSSIGVNAPAMSWYMAEGCSAYGFETWLLLQNPNADEATCRVTYMIEGENLQVFEKKVPGNSRRSYSMEADIGAKNASIQVESDIPVIPERSMYRNNRREGHDSIGTNAPSNNYYLAEGTTAWGFTTYVMVQNPNDTEAQVNMTYMTDSGPVQSDPMTMPANSRRTIKVNDVLHEADFSTRLQSDKPIVAERSMYWGEGTSLGEACHGTIGMSTPHAMFYFPDGQSSDGRETYILVQNPNNQDVEVEVTFLTPYGVENKTVTRTIAANSRSTFNMAETVESERAATVVTSKTEGLKINAERSMYWNSRGAGTCTIGACSD
ncbi:MAG: IPT/TIG domain-containing protein [Actinobacteria bacterium]|nr:IPT/TIG domain-containing protein [Actinomycetota bacterium]